MRGVSTGLRPQESHRLQCWSRPTHSTLPPDSAVIVYSADKAQFLRDNDDREIEEVIQHRFFRATGRQVPEAERRSWRESLGRIASILRDVEIPVDTGVAVEFHIPQSSKRIDVTLTGYGEDGRKSAIIVELKQWEGTALTEKDGIIVTYLGGALREVVHPSYQAWSYAALLEGFNEAVYDGAIELQPCAYLHNHPRDGVIDSPHYQAYITKAPLFLRGEDEKDNLRQFIKRHIKTGDGKEILFELERGRVRPSKALADSLSKLLKGSPEFVLIDDQKTVYEACLRSGQTASEAKPRVVLIEGGPGTGKTVLAVNLLVSLTAKGLLCKYVTKNAAPRAVFEAKLTGSMTATRYRALFSGSGAFTDTPANGYDVLVVDEAHRLNEKSGFYGNEGDHQVRELISSAKCAIFFLDEDQRVTLKDIGTRQLIEAMAAEQGATIETYKLESQFRCGGSDGYLAWLDHVLGVRESTNTDLEGIPFDFRVFESPEEMHAAIEAKNGTNKARVVAGYCWPWASKKRPSEFDITIGDYRRRWNLDRDGSLWIIAPESINEVGCIHTCQGLEVDYVGVIVGPDLIARNGTLETVPEARAPQDKTLRGYRSMLRSDPVGTRRAADEIIRNTYRTLMTRGMKGCYVFCTDPATAAYFRTMSSRSAGGSQDL